MRNLLILVATTAVVSGQRPAPPSFGVDYRSFSGSPIYQDLPFREQARSFRESGQPPLQHHPQSFRQGSYRDYRQPGREETRVFREGTRGGFKDDAQVYKEDNPEGFKDDLRNYNEEGRRFRDEARIFKDESRGFREEIRPFKDDVFFRDEHRGFGEGERNFKDERAFREEHRPFREEIRSYRDDGRPYRDEHRPFRDDHRPYRDEIRLFEGPKHYRDEPRPFKNEARPFREELPMFRDERPFREETGGLRNEPRPFREESRPKDELLFTQESRTLAEAHHRFNKEHQQRQPLSFGGHSNYLKYGNHGLGFPSVPAAILPLEESSHQLSSGMMIPDMTTTAATQSPHFANSAVPAPSSSSESSEVNGRNAVTLAPEADSTSSQSTSGNTIDTHTANHHRTNENLVDGVSTSPASTAVTISTSGGTDMTSKVVFGSRPASTTGVDSSSDVQASHVASANTLRPSKPDILDVEKTGSYFSSNTSPEVPAALLNYVFQYRLPEESKPRYTYQHFQQPESFNPIQTDPHIHHHQPAKYTILPELKIPGLSGIQKTEGAMNYLSTAGLPKVSYLTTDSPAVALGASYSAASVPTVNYARNLVQFDRNNPFSHLGQAGQLTPLQAQPDQYTQLSTLASNEHLAQLGQYGHLGQAHQTRNAHYSQGGLQLQLGGFGGIDFSALSGNSEVSRRTPTVSFGLSEPLRPDASPFTKMSFGESI